jgi:hypothetical protein
MPIFILPHRQRRAVTPAHSWVTDYPHLSGRDSRHCGEEFRHYRKQIGQSIALGA